jgi:hypothetical protein
MEQEKGSKPEILACFYCLYWQGPWVKERHKGQCRRYPPTLLGDAVEGCIQEWPDMSPDSWCGEFVKRPGADSESGT